MTAVWIALIVAVAAVVVLGAVAASGLGPLRSLRKTVDGFADLQAEADRLRRSVEVLERRTTELREGPADPT
jgi:cell division protein FtsB